MRGDKLGVGWYITSCKQVIISIKIGWYYIRRSQTPAPTSSTAQSASIHVFLFNFEKVSAIQLVLFQCHFHYFWYRPVIVWTRFFLKNFLAAEKAATLTWLECQRLTWSLQLFQNMLPPSRNFKQWTSILPQYPVIHLDYLVLNLVLAAVTAIVIQKSCPG